MSAADDYYHYHILVLVFEFSFYFLFLNKIVVENAPVSGSTRITA